MSSSPLQNRVDPTGAVIATPARGAWFGNRGCLHEAQGRIRRTHANRRWIYCLLEFKGRRRQPLMQPGKYTELFFLDEATALAAGHRPCAECQRDRFNELRGLWPRGGAPRADAIDAVLHRERIDSDRRKVTFEATLGWLPDGAMVLDQTGAPRLLWRGSLRRWRPDGYDDARKARAADRVSVLTPRSLVEVLARGFEVQTADLRTR